jgi:hypothetical protein
MGNHCLLKRGIRSGRIHCWLAPYPPSPKRGTIARFCEGAGISPGTRDMRHGQPTSARYTGRLSICQDTAMPHLTAARPAMERDEWAFCPALALSNTLRQCRWASSSQHRTERPPKILPEPFHFKPRRPKHAQRQNAPNGNEGPGGFPVCCAYRSLMSAKARYTLLHIGRFSLFSPKPRR